MAPGLKTSSQLTTALGASVVVGIVSDTHGHWDQAVEDFFAPCQEVWHAGDIGSLELADRIARFRPLRAVYGNVDDARTRAEIPSEQLFTLAGLRIYMVHIGGYPKRYAPGVRARLQELRPDIFVSGHSHILRVMPDPRLGLLYINPGAYGQTGFHHVRTALRLEITRGKPSAVEVLERPRGNGEVHHPDPC